MRICVHMTDELFRKNAALGTVEDAKQFSSLIRKKAKSLGMTFSDLAVRTKLSEKSLRNILNFQSVPYIESVCLLAPVLKEHPMTLLEGLSNLVLEADLSEVRAPHSHSMVQHLNYSQGVIMSPRATIEKKFRITNTTTQQISGCVLQCLHDDLRCYHQSNTERQVYELHGLAPEVMQIEIPDLQPNEFHDISIQLTAPAVISTTAITYWLLVDQHGQPLISGERYSAYLIANITSLGDTLAFEEESNLEQIESVPDFREMVLSRMKEVGLNRAELARKCQISEERLRQLLTPNPHKIRAEYHYPTLATFSLMAFHLQVHRYWLMRGLLSRFPIPSYLERKIAGRRCGFVHDPDYPDGVIVKPGQHFIKRWVNHNVGNGSYPPVWAKCIDPEIVVSINGDKKRMSDLGYLKPDAYEFHVPEWKVGEVQTIEMGFTAPEKEGVYLSCWSAYTEQGHLFSEELPVGLVVVIKVVAGS